MTPAGTLCFERLQVIQDDAARPGALNMALDEVLLNDPADVARLRFYRWAQPTVSFGYFDPVESARRVARGREIVRRLTGGGIVEHGADLTFTLVVPRADAFTRLRSAESYRLIHAAVASALACCGLAALAHDDPAPARVDDGQPNACFERPVLHDLIASGKKVVGGAQRRNRVGLMHQGSVRFGSAGGVPEGLWEDALRRELPLALSRTCANRSHTADEITRAGALAAAKYATSAWTGRV